MNELKEAAMAYAAAAEAYAIADKESSTAQCALDKVSGREYADRQEARKNAWVLRAQAQRNMEAAAIATFPN